MRFLTHAEGRCDRLWRRACASVSTANSMRQTPSGARWRTASGGDRQCEAGLATAAGAGEGQQARRSRVARAISAISCSRPMKRVSGAGRLAPARRGISCQPLCHPLGATTERGSAWRSRLCHIECPADAEGCRPPRIASLRDAISIACMMHRGRSSSYEHTILIRRWGGYARLQEWNRKGGTTRTLW